MSTKKRDAAAIAAFKKTIEEHAAAMHPKDVTWEPENFRVWMEQCKTALKAELSNMIDFVDGNLAAASGKQPYTAVRSHFSAFAHAQMASRFPPENAGAEVRRG